MDVWGEALMNEKEEDEFEQDVLTAIGQKQVSTDDRWWMDRWAKSAPKLFPRPPLVSEY